MKKKEELIGRVESDILRYLDKTPYTDHLKQITKELRNEFNQSIKGIHPSKTYKDRFETLLKDYQTKVILAHNYFVDNGGTCQEQPSGRWAYALPTNTQRQGFTQLRDKAYFSRIALNDYQNQAGSRTQDVMLEDDLRKDKRNEAIKTGLKRAGGIGLVAAGVGAALLAGAKAGEKLSSSSDKEEAPQPKMVHRVSAEEAKQYTQDYGASQQGWVMDGAATLNTAPQKTQTFVETEDIHEITEEYSTPQPQVQEIIEEVHVPVQPKVVKKVVHTPVPPTVIHEETIEEIHEQVEENARVYRTTMSPRVKTTTPVVRTTQVIQPVVEDHSVEVAAISGLSNVGVAVANAWGDAKVAKYMSRKGPDVVSVTNIDDHSVRGSFNDNSSRVSANTNTYSPTNIQANRTTTVDASRRTYAPTTVDASSRTYSPTTTTSRTTTNVGNNSNNTRNSSRSSVRTTTNTSNTATSIRGRTMTQRLGSQRVTSSSARMTTSTATRTSSVTSRQGTSARTTALSRTSNQGGRNGGASFRTSSSVRARGTSRR